MSKSSVAELVREEGSLESDIFESIDDFGALKPKEDSHNNSNVTILPNVSDESRSSQAYYKDLQNTKASSLHRVSVKRLPSFISLSIWHSEISDVDEENEAFYAKIINQDEETENSNEDDFMEFSFSDVKSDEQKYIQVGSLFNWHIGYHRDPKGTKRNTSLIVFRKMPVWKNKKADAENKANFFYNLFQKFSN